MDQNNTSSTRGAKGAKPPATRRRPPKTGAAVQMQVQDHIGRQLRAVYDDLLSQPVPDRFLELLEQLDKGTAGDGSGPPEADQAKAPPKGEL